PDAAEDKGAAHMKVRTWLALSAAAMAAALWVPGTQAQQGAELLIRNGLIVTVEGRTEADVRIRGEKIVEIGRNLTAGAGARQIDARGKLLLPGGVDPRASAGGAGGA